VALRAAAEVGDGGGRHWSRRRRPPGVDCGGRKVSAAIGFGIGEFWDGKEIEVRVDSIAGAQR
jgi:hypothetical protein